MIESLHWSAVHKLPFTYKRTYEADKAPNLTLTYDKPVWQVRIDMQVIRDFHYLVDAKAYGFKVVSFAERKARGYDISDKLTRCLHSVGREVFRL